MNEPEEPKEKELEAPDMENLLRDSSDIQYSTEIPQGSPIINADPQQDSLQIELPSGFKFSASSIRVSVFDLGNLAIQLHEHFTKGTIKKKKGGYLG